MHFLNNKTRCKLLHRVLHLVEHIFFNKDDCCNNASNHGYSGWEPPLWNRQTRNVHSIKTKNDIRDRHNDCNNC